MIKSHKIKPIDHYLTLVFYSQVAENLVIQIAIPNLDFCWSENNEGQGQPSLQNN